MPYKLFMAGEEGLASDVNTYLMNQSVMVFTNATDRDANLTAPTEGMFVYLTASDHYQFYNGSAWVTTDLVWNAYTPTFLGLVVGVGGLTQAYYARIGKTVITQVYVRIGTSLYSISGQIRTSLPVDHASSNRSITAGMAYMYDYSVSTGYVAPVSLTGSAPGYAGLNALNASTTWLTMTTGTATVPFGWSASDYFSYTIIYEGV